MADGSLFGRLHGPVVVDLFAGGGGASHGIREALGVSPVAAINHCAHAIQMHALNHPDTLHFQESVFDVEPMHASRGRRVDLLWASPDCTHFSRAKGGKPRDKGIRSLAWVIVDWARDVRPTCIAMENVPEFQGWGPLDDEGQPVKAQAGETFREFVGALEREGYVVSWRVINAADYGTPTSRRRLFLIARRDGKPLVWPSPSHGPGRTPYRTAAECIDWSIPCPSIFERKRELAPATLRRIAEGVRRYVLGERRPFLLCLTHGGRLEPLDEPMRTITTANRGERALVSPVLVANNTNNAPHSVEKPLGTVTSGGRHILAAATLINTRNGEREGQRPRALDIEAPLPTTTATGSQGAVVAAFLSQHNGRSVGSAVDGPAPTTTGSGHASLVAAFLARYHGTGGQWGALDDPSPCVTAREGLALVTVEIAGETYVLTDIGMRMLQPRELARAQGFPDSYVLIGSKGDQVARIGNSVCPPVAAAIVRALMGVA